MPPNVLSTPNHETFGLLIRFVHKQHLTNNNRGGNYRYRSKNNTLLEEITLWLLCLHSVN